MKSVFVVMVKYVKPMEQVDAVVDAHRKYLDKFYEKKVIFCSGRQNPRVGGVILCQADSREEVWRLIRDDPYYTHGVAEYDVTEFVPSRIEEIPYR